MYFSAFIRFLLNRFHALFPYILYPKNKSSIAVCNQQRFMLLKFMHLKLIAESL